ncbi:hypothetical protein D3Z53_06990 [Lachnospiraceae bacterium]|nr:hypothetical protein C808_00990 [Lachnospiraceae bacterium M18-1]NBI57822.1 hypothetical protein [Lachnospiraceae bacterium]
MPKFMNIDLLGNLEKIMRMNTRSYQSDFEWDRETLMDAAVNADIVPLRDRIYLWMSRPCGTWCVKEKDVFLEPACAYNIWSYYAGETSQRILAYAVEVMGMEDKKAVGNLYPLDYRKHVESVKNAAIPADRIRMVYEKGERFENRKKPLSKQDDAVFGRYRFSEYMPNNREAWEAALYQEERKREMMRCGKIEDHIRKLAG